MSGLLVIFCVVVGDFFASLLHYEGLISKVILDRTGDGGLPSRLLSQSQRRTQGEIETTPLVTRVERQ